VTPVAGRLPLDRRACRERARVEDSAEWLKENRRTGTRRDTLAVNVQAFLDAAIIRRYLRLLAP
jgi:hypothetical protein